MMYVSFRNFLKCICVISLFSFPCTADANPAYPGLDGGSQYQYGPDGKGKTLRGATRYSSNVDAYGNPIVPLEPKKRKVPIERTLKMPEPTRPLPKVQDEPINW